MPLSPEQEAAKPFGRPLSFWFAFFIIMAIGLFLRYGILVALVGLFILSRLCFEISSGEHK